MPKTLYVGNCIRNGIDITWTRSREKQLYISGWYDSCVGIEGEELSLRYFFNELGITEKDCQKAFADRKEPNASKIKQKKRNV
jgi:hypothetical protein